MQGGREGRRREGEWGKDQGWRVRVCASGRERERARARERERERGGGGGGVGVGGGVTFSKASHSQKHHTLKSITLSKGNAKAKIQGQTSLYGKRKNLVSTSEKF
jgi:hypothetical protein